MNAEALVTFARDLLPLVGIEPATVDEVEKCGAARALLERIVAGEQPPPRPVESRPIWSLVVDDMCARDELGRRRYGVPLQAGNGRDALRDAYEEALDLVAYLRQALEERGDK